MEILCARNIITGSRSKGSWPRLGRKHKVYSFGIRTFRRSNGGFFHSRSIRSKLSDFQDYQGYARPSRLFPATEVKVSKEISQYEKLKFFSVGCSESLIKIKIQTSRMYGSSLSDVNAGLLVCMIDESGDSILQRIPAIGKSAFSSKSEEELDPQELHFQRGSVDEFIFEGPKLERIKALWITVESGQWRLGGVSLSVVRALDEEPSGEEVHFGGFHYDFVCDDVLLGEGSDTSMVELRPRQVIELAGPDPFTLLSTSLEEPISPSMAEASNEESMKEYADLKLSLLLYDTMLIVIGASVASVSSGENAALAFLTGGVGGFLYLLLLQRSVDGLPAPASISRSTLDQLFGQLWGPVSTLSVAVAFVLLALKYSSGENPTIFTPKELILGMVGFLTCKVAVVLAAFKPMAISFKQQD